MPRNLLKAVLVLGVAVSCSTSTAAAVGERAYQLTTPYDPAAHEVADGANAIQGNALIPLSDGDSTTCAGKSVFLVPVTPYTTERMMVTYDSDREGYRSVRIKQRGIRIAGFGKRTREAFPRFEPENEHYDQSAGRETRCDSRGDFEFSGIADGDYYVMTAITWQYSGMIPDGGSLMRRASVRGGRTVKVVLAP